MDAVFSVGDSSNKKSLNPFDHVIRVLYVDDDESFLSTTKQIMELKNLFNVETASLVTDAIKKLQQTDFDVVVSDYQMPEKDGLAFLSELHERGINLPFILFTGKGREEVAIKALNLGADYYINKTGHPETVYSQLSHYIIQAVRKKKAEERLQHKLEFESAIARISSRLVSYTDFSEAIKDSLEDIGSISGSSHVYLYLTQENGSTFDQFIEWVKKGVPSDPELVMSITHDMVPWGIKHLSAGKILLVNNVDTMPPEAEAEKKLLISHNIKSVVVLPITVLGEFAGFIGLDNVEKTETWNSDDIALLQIVSELIGTTLQRKKTEDNYRTVFESTGTAMCIIENDMTISTINRQFANLTGYPPEEIEGKKWTDFVSENFLERMQQYHQARRSGGKPPKNYSFEYVNRSGEIRSGLLTIQLIPQTKKSVASILDITESKNTEEKLKESEKKYRLLTQNITDALFIQDMTLKVTYASPSIEALSGYTPEEVYTLKTEDFMTPESFKRGVVDFKEAISLALEGRDCEIPLKQYEYIRKDGSKFWGELKTKLLRGPEGNLVGLQGTLRDITERKITEEKLKESEKKYRLLTENIIDVVFIQDLDLMVTYVSPSVESLTGYTPEELYKMHPKEFIAPSSYEQALSSWKKAISSADKQPDNPIRLMQYEYVRKDGSTFWGELKVKLLHDSAGRLVGTQGTLRDITERKQIEEKLKESEQMYRLMTENTTDVLFIQNLDLSVKYVSPSVEALSGYTPEEVIELGPKFLMTPESFEQGAEDFKKAVAVAEKNPEVEFPFWRYQYLRKDGSRAWGEFKAKFLRDSEGNLVGMLGALRDITERKKAEDALRQEREMLELVTSNINAGLTIISRDYQILWANSFLTKTFGNIIGKTCYSVYNNHGKICPGCGVKEIFETGKDNVVHEQLVPGDDGQNIWLELTVNPIRDENGSIIAASELSVFLNERKEMENKLREAERRYRLLFDKAPLGIMMLDHEGRAVEFNDEARRQLGYTREELSKLTVADIDAFDTPENIKLRMKEIQETGQIEFETKHRTKNGELRDVTVVARSIELDGKPFCHVIKQDITERKKTEQKLNKMMEELQRANEKLSVVGKLTRHDTRNKLSVIANQVYLAKKKLGKGNNSLESLDSIEAAIDQVEKIFTFARTYEMLGAKELTYIDVKNCVKESLMLFSDMNKIKFVNECSGLSVLSDSLLRQLFYNLIDNSLKYGETVTQIRTFYVEEQDHLKIIYEDDGVGIPTIEKEKIFLERYGKGTGYGLYLIRKMCEVYGWTIKETGEEGKGAQFTITIPRLDKSENPSYTLVS